MFQAGGRRELSLKSIITEAPTGATPGQTEMAAVKSSGMRDYAKSGGKPGRPAYRTPARIRATVHLRSAPAKAGKKNRRKWK